MLKPRSFFTSSYFIKSIINKNLDYFTSFIIIKEVNIVITIIRDIVKITNVNKEDNQCCLYLGYYDEMDYYHSNNLDLVDAC